MAKLNKILIANRGEIAIRVIRACRDAGITSVGIFSDCDRTALHTRMADEVYHVGPSPSRESYLRGDKIIDIARKCGAQAIHPGYGFLAENAEFAKACEAAGIIFIGPKAETISLLGDKLEARKLAVKAGLPVVPGAEFEKIEPAAIKLTAKKIGFPVLIKAAAGGGGKGMRVVNDEAALTEAVESASREAKAAFGDGRVFLEKYLQEPRHIEIQIFADRHGHAIHLGERECSIQRRHQKVIEESPSPVMTPELREKMGRAAVSIVMASGYIGAGTVEFLVDKELNFYFLEVNTRLQVEHPVTEAVTGVDLVREQFRVAEGENLSIKQEDIRPRGHAIECRIYAEDPHDNFMPSIGRINQYRVPTGPGVRVDSGVVAGSEIPLYYDPIIAKMIVWGETRAQAIERTVRALEEYRVAGVHTTIGFAVAVMRNGAFQEGRYATDFIDREFPDRQFAGVMGKTELKAALAAAVYDYTNRQKITISMKNDRKTPGGWITYHRARGVRRLKD